mmetsp:Transcript_10438/g.17248  ORF Transcript_10438/g.17248 Transcript_10438/m.17248 type:complete len:86 (-) Transcript_10438:784-1041(-)
MTLRHNGGTERRRPTKNARSVRRGKGRRKRELERKRNGVTIAQQRGGKKPILDFVLAMGVLFCREQISSFYLDSRFHSSTGGSLI